MACCARCTNVLWLLVTLECFWKQRSFYPLPISPKGSCYMWPIMARESVGALRIVRQMRLVIQRWESTVLGLRVRNYLWHSVHIKRHSGPLQCHIVSPSPDVALGIFRALLNRRICCVKYHSNPLCVYWVFLVFCRNNVSGFVPFLSRDLL